MGKNSNSTVLNIDVNKHRTVYKIIVRANSTSTAILTELTVYDTKTNHSVDETLF